MENWTILFSFTLNCKCFPVFILFSVKCMLGALFLIIIFFQEVTEKLIIIFCQKLVFLSEFQKCDFLTYLKSSHLNNDLKSAIYEISQHIFIYIWKKIMFLENVWISKGISHFIQFLFFPLSSTCKHITCRNIKTYAHIIFL